SLGALTQDPCLICGYPSWTEACGDENEERELVCSNFNDLQLSSASSCLGCAVLAHAWEYGTPAADDRTEEYITFNRCSGILYVHPFKRRSVLNIDVFTVAHTPRCKHVRLGALIPLIPPGLLDLENGSPDIICLVELEQRDVEDARVDFRHACLSHCWGKTQHKHLTRRSNLATNLNGLPTSDLPPTFRGAIAISRALSIRYLWIDSLCIVQDDHADWEIHVHEMAQIYCSAYITLAAGASADNDGGFFRQAMLPFSSPFSFKLHEGWPAGPEMPLMGRGWVFQERLLSRRFLYFAANEVLWECLEDVACSYSTTADGFKDHGLSEKPVFLNCQPSKFEFAKIGDLPREKLWSLWRELVTQYTRRKLTLPGDKLPALAGLARNFQAVKAGEYAHGMWVDCIKKDMWQNRGSSHDKFRPRKAPSWS
ncbi:HET-domain-containing protein, partial [Acephala macrosclerotiorum]